MFKILGLSLVMSLFPFSEGISATRYTDVSALTEVSCVDINHGADTFVMVTAGQSNAANSVSQQYTPTQEVYMFYNGKCYEATDPLLGTTGVGGSTWGRLADNLILNKGYTNVVIIGTAVGSSSIAEWVPATPNFTFSVTQTYQASQLGLDADAFLFQQGEADTVLGTSLQAYYANLSSFRWGLVNYGGITAPFYVSKTSYCFGEDSLEIRQAQGYAANTLWNTFAGPNTDTLGNEYRYDNCHMNATGSEVLADMWEEVLPSAK